MHECVLIKTLFLIFYQIVGTGTSPELSDLCSTSRHKYEYDHAVVHSYKKCDAAQLHITTSLRNGYIIIFAVECAHIILRNIIIDPLNGK